MIQKEIIIYTTCPNSEIATKIAKTLIEKKIIACANIFPQGTSIFEWNNKIEIEKECVMILKTTNKFYKDCEKIILELHTYEVPAIIYFEIRGGSTNYLNWIKNQVKTSLISNP